MYLSADFSGKTIAVAVTGGIAAYRACDFIRELYRRGAARVICLMTPSAQSFVTPLSLQALSREPVITDDLSVAVDGTPMHIAIAQQADALVILPATANAIAKLAHGMADDPVTTTALTFTGKPVIVVPAMNTRMWQNPLTQQNLETLRQLSNVSIVEPVSGHLACGETGEGHLAPEGLVLLALSRAVHPNAKCFEGIRAVVTAGGTEEPIDPVRVISNHSSGRMGVALADELHAMGADVTLVFTPVVEALLTVPRMGLQRPYNLLPVGDARAMQATLQQEVIEKNTDLLVMAAAVSDFHVANPASEKLKRERDSAESLTADALLNVPLLPNADILAGLGAQKQSGQVFVGFAAESENGLAHARGKLSRKNLDAIVLNDISRNDIGFGSEDNEVTVLLKDNGEPVHLAKQDKGLTARAILNTLVEGGLYQNQRMKETSEISMPTSSRL